jgi:hypothetical protein
MTVCVTDADGKEKTIRISYGVTMKKEEKSDDDGDGDGNGGSNIVLYAAIAAIAAIAMIAVAYVFVIRPRMKA